MSVDVTSREELNDRFKQVYQQLEENGQIVKNNRQKSKSAFARKLGTKGHIIDKFLRDERFITFEQSKRLCDIYNVNETFLFQGTGSMFAKSSPTPDTSERLAMALGIDFSPNILFTSVEAFASNTVSVDLIEENQHFHIPGVQGDLVAFYINGDSMSPTIKAGDMVICQALEDLDTLQEDQIYAVVTNQSVWVKRLEKCTDIYGKWNHLRLVSDNSDEYDPFLLDLQEVRRVLKVKKRLSNLE